MIFKNHNALGLTVLIVLVALSWVHGNYTGRQSIKASYAKKALKLQAKLNELKIESKKEIEAKQREIEEKEKKANEEIKKLIAKNKKLADWWKSFVPDDAINYAFQLH